MAVRLALLAILCAAAGAQDATLRAYDVGALVPPGRSALRDYVPEPEFALLGPRPLRTEFPECSWLPEEDARVEHVAETVREILRGVAPDADIGLAEDTGVLLVTASAEDHGRIQRAMDLLAAQAGTPFEIEVRHLSLAGVALDDALPLLHAAAAGTASEADLQRLRGLDGLRSRSGVLSAPHGRWTTWRSVRRLVYVPDFDVEIAQGSGISDPQSVQAVDGLQAAVRPFLLQDGRVLLRVVASAGDLDEPFRRLRVGTGDLAWLHRATHWTGELELADYRGGAVATELLLEAGGTRGVLVGSPADPRGARLDLLLFSVRAAPRPAPAGTFVVVPAGALCASDMERILAWGGEGRDSKELVLAEGAENPRGWLDLNWLVRRLGLEAAQEHVLHEAPWLHGGGMVLRADEAAAKALQAKMGELEALHLRPAAVALDVRAGDGRFVAALRAPVLVGRRSCFAGYWRRDIVEDYDVEVAQESRICDPVTRPVYAGLFANVDLAQGAGRERRLRLDLRLSAFTGEIRETAPGTDCGPVQSQPAWVRSADLTLDLPPGARKTLDLGGGLQAVLWTE